MPQSRFGHIVRHLWAVLCIIAVPVLAQDRALPPLADDVAAEFPAIGRLGQARFRIKQGCTATLIAPDLVVTAAHCVSATGHSARVFVAGWSRGDYIAARTSAGETRHPDYASEGTHHPHNDIALMVLDSPITDVAPIPLGDVAADDLNGTEAAIIGYHRQTPHLLSGDFTCPVTTVTPGLLHLGCPVINGNSGSPVLAQTPQGDWQVVAVVSSQQGTGAIAVTLSDWLWHEVAAHGQ